MQYGKNKTNLCIIFKRELSKIIICIYP